MAVTPNTDTTSIDSDIHDPTTIVSTPLPRERRAPTTEALDDLARVRTPLWRRLTALVSLGSMVVIVGTLLAALLGISALLLMMILERAAG